MDIKCPVCAQSLVSLFALHMHCINAHEKEFFTCPWCTMPFTSLRTLQNHGVNCPEFLEDEPQERVINTALVVNNKCLVCEGTFPSDEAAIEHYKEQHLAISYICVVCQMYFQQFSSWSTHYASCFVEAALPKETARSNVVEEIQNKKRPASVTFDSVGEAGPSAKEKKNDASTSLSSNQSGTIIFICNDCDNECQLRQSVEFHQKNCQKRDKDLRPNNIKEAAVSLQKSKAVVNRTIFACLLCEYENVSRELVKAHQMTEHGLTLMSHQNNIGNREKLSENNRNGSVTPKPDKSTNDAHSSSSSSSSPASPCIRNQNAVPINLPQATSPQNKPTDVPHTSELRTVTTNYLHRIEARRASITVQSTRKLNSNSAQNSENFAVPLPIKTEPNYDLRPLRQSKPPAGGK